MEAKQKAIELIKKFNPFVYCYMGSGMLTNESDDNVILMMSKSCANIAVDEMLLHLQGIGNIINISYWTDVKGEIEKATLEDMKTV